MIPSNPAATARWIGAWNGSDVSPGAAIAPPSIGNDADTDMPNPLNPDLMTPAERLDEIAEVLATGILRVRARLRAPRGSTTEQVRVDFLPNRSGHVRPSGQRRRRT
jgi:hypothetical protein